MSAAEVFFTSATQQYIQLYLTIASVNEIARSKEIRITNDMQEWFDREISELIHACEKIFLKFKKSKLHIDEENYQKVKYQFQNLVRKQGSNQ